jgi:putative endonuclease
MAGLVPAIHVYLNKAMAGGWFYLMTNRRNGILYAGVTANLPRRAYEHRAGLVTGVHEALRTKDPRVLRALRRYPPGDQREKTIKHWPRAWKVRLIHAENPEWSDLYDTLI